MIDRQFTPPRMGACARRNRARSNANYRSTI